MRYSLERTLVESANPADFHPYFHEWLDGEEAVLTASFIGVGSYGEPDWIDLDWVEINGDRLFEVSPPAEAWLIGLARKHEFLESEE